MTTTELTDAPDVVSDDQEPAEEDAATKARRAHVKAEDAVFLTDGMIEETPPPATRQATYVRSPYDDAMDNLWQRYLDAGSPAWSLSAGRTADDKPAEGWYMDRAPWLSTVVPNLDVAESLLRRAGNRIGCTYRLRSDPAAPSEGETPAESYKIWFTAAPVMKRPRKAKGEATESTVEA